MGTLPSLLGPESAHINDRHPKIDNAVYNGADGIAPVHTKTHEYLTKYHGNLQASDVIGNILPSVQTGDLHIALYDLTNSFMWLSFARRPVGGDESEPQMAYERQFTKMDMKSVFSVPKPSA